MSAAKKTNKPQPNTSSASHSRISFVLLAIAVVAAFSSAISNGITNWDDGVYLTENALIKELSWKNLKNIFSTYIASNYHPVTILSYAIEYYFFKLNPVVYHLVNIAIHLFNTWLVYILINQLIKNNTVSLVTAMLFAVHPMHVESVAWISERKDVLYTFFFLLSLIWYLKYTVANEHKIKLYAYSLLFFLLSLLSKGMAVTLPLILLLFDFFKERKITRSTVLEKIPFFLLSLVFGLIAVYAQRSTQAMELKAGYSFVERIFLGSYGFSLYLSKLLWPFNLSAFYPYPAKAGESFPVLVYLSVIVPLLFLVAIVISWKKKKKNKLVFTGLSFFVVTIVLVLQFIPVGNAIIAERYSYISYIGLFFIVAAYFNKWYVNKKNAQAAMISVIACSLLLIVVTHERCKVWKDSESLWSDVINKHPEADIAYLNRGIYIVMQGKIKEANDDFTKAIELNSRYKEAYNNRGLLRQNRNDVEGSIEDFTKAIEADPGYYEAYSNRGVSYIYQKKHDYAIKDFDKTLELYPGYANVYSNRGNVYIDLGDMDKGMKDLLKAKALYLENDDRQGLQRVNQRINQLNANVKQR